VLTLTSTDSPTNCLMIAGYILTRETLRRLVEQGLDQEKCPTGFKGQEDDVTISRSITYL
jgi:hypothetical protein